MECCHLSPLADAVWADYQADGNLEALATRHAQFFRSIFVPSLTLGLARAHETGQRSIFADRFENALKRRLASQPAALHSFVQTLVLAKRRSARIDAVVNAAP